ncbi:MAG: hypothetical protein GYB23_01095 [Vibrionaceae bacterium]|nr:hypothetical protein [Vibrionaceae bacterium]
MHLKLWHTIWLTLLTTLILLVSSVVNSAPLMNLKMMSDQTIAKQAEHCGSHSMNMSMTISHRSASSDMSMSCSDGLEMVHDCCPTSCSFVFVSLPVPENQLSLMAHRATINIESNEPVAKVSHDLYRPPIV